MKAYLKITQSLGDESNFELGSRDMVTIGRAKDNDIVLMDGKASRYHAHMRRGADGSYTMIDGAYVGGELKRSSNQVVINGLPIQDKRLEAGDDIKIGESRLKYLESDEVPASPEPSLSIPRPAPISEQVQYDDKPLGASQVFIAAQDIISLALVGGDDDEPVTPEEIKILRRKERNLEMLYELSRSFSVGFDLKAIFNRATDIIFRGTPADRVVALVTDDSTEGEKGDHAISPIAVRARDPKMEEEIDSLTISRTITQKVMREKVSLLSQDVSVDSELNFAMSIVAQGVRSTICAPLITESSVHGVIYADRLDPLSPFSSDDLELVTAVAAQMAVMVETVKAHTRLAREEVARANYGRFMPENVVKQLLEKPESFALGGVNQKVTVLFADIRGFTAFSENEDPERVVTLLNRYLSAMSDIIFSFGGTLDKFMGDGIMALFGAPTAGPKDASNALKAAVEMQRRLLKLNEELEADGLHRVEIGIGLHTGIATVGYIGSDKRSEYTAIGDTVNLAARLEQNSSRGQILISGATADECGDVAIFITKEPLKVKNRREPVTLFEVDWRQEV